MPSSLIRGKHVICKVLSRTDVEIIDDGAIFQQDGKIVEIGKYDDLAAKYQQPDQVIGSSEHVVMPGFVNSHHHVGLTPFQLGSPDYPLELWFASRLAARNLDLYLDTLYSAFEMIESGITTVQHIHGWRPGPASTWPAIAEQVLKAYQDIGMRVSYCRKLCCLKIAPPVWALGNTLFPRHLPSLGVPGNAVATQIGQWSQHQPRPGV